jgi:hypothetical protein
MDADNLKVSGWGGVLHKLAIYARDIYLDADCPLNAADRRSAPQASTPGPIFVFRDFHNALAGDSLKPWMRRYEDHRAELLNIVQSNPGVVARLVAVSLKNRAAVHGNGWRMSAESARGVTELCKEVKAVASPELGRLMDDVTEVINEGVGRSFAELADKAAARLPSPPVVRPVPSHRMGRRLTS